MLDTLSLLPTSFWMTVLVLLTGGAWALTLIRQGIGLPMLAVLGTIAAWYVGDVIYNDYVESFHQVFTPSVLAGAWWQVTGFLLLFLLLTPMMHGWMNGDLRHRSSQVRQLTQTGAGNPQFQSSLNQYFRWAGTVWLGLVGIACFRLGNQSIYYFFPYLGYVADPWGREQIGGGFSALLSAVGYLQLFLATSFGLVAALAKDGRVRALALIACGLTWPSYIFGRTRNTMLAVVMPGLLAWVCIRLRTSWATRFALLAVCFFMVHSWFAFVLANRGGVGIVQAAMWGTGVSIKEAQKDTHHLGLNMFEELCWADTFIATDEYQIAWGQRYFAELVNPIPRGLWQDKPLIGMDYATLRGQRFETGLGVTATISTGLIGQGVVNFGGILGPAFVAVLMSLWAALLARLDLRGQELGSLPLYALGMITTFNLGRDITFITLYTFVFGMILVWLIKRRGQTTGAVRRARGRDRTAER